jgi:hypothetical protein
MPGRERPAPPSSPPAGASSRIIERSDDLRRLGVTDSRHLSYSNREGAPALRRLLENLLNCSVDAKQTFRLTYLLHVSFLVTGLGHLACFGDEIG